MQEIEKLIQSEYSHGEQNSIVYDGAINLEKWEGSSPKILFYYKETYGYNDYGGTSITEHFKDWINHGIPTYRKIGLLSYLINEFKESENVKTFDEINFKSLYQNTPLQIQEIQKVAVVNIGKISIAQNKTSDSKIRDESKKRKILLKKQIKYLNPDIIICGGRVTADSLFHDIELLTKSQYTHEVSELVNNKIISPFQHFSSPSCGYKRLYNYYLQITELLKHISN